MRGRVEQDGDGGDREDTTKLQTRSELDLYCDLLANELER